MTLFDLLFDNEAVDADVALEGYEYYSFTPDGRLLYFKKSHFMSDTDYLYDISGFLDIDDEEEKAYLSCGDYDTYVDYSWLASLLSITIEGSVNKREGCQRNQFVAVRGDCDHNCPRDCPSGLKGYALHELPCCDRQYIGSTLCTGKWATNVDMIKDILIWMRYCKGLNVLIINFDFTPNPFIECNRDLDFDYVCFCALIEGSHIKFINNAEDIERLYHEYSRQYWCMDYDIERSINFDLEDLDKAFRLERPKGEKN